MKQIYGLTQTKFVPLGSISVYTLLDQGKITGVTCSRRIRQLDPKYTILVDDKHIFGFQNVAPVVTKKLARSNGALLACTVNAVSAKLTIQAMIAMNKAYYDRQEVARSRSRTAFLTANKLLTSSEGRRSRRRVDRRALRRRPPPARRRGAITLVESRLVGGECSYYACMPTKTMLRATELGVSLDRAPGLQPERPDADGVWWWRDRVTSDWDDVGPAELARGVELPARARRGRVAGRASSRSTGRSSSTTGSSSRPARGRRSRRSTGLDSVEYWTNRDATRTHEVPESLVVIGGGPVGVELAQFFSPHGLAA